MTRSLPAVVERVGTIVAMAVTVLFVIAIASVAIGVHMGYQAVLMQTGSMTPSINPGDMAILDRTTPASIRVGDAITFVEPDTSNTLVTHRVVAIAQTAAGPMFTTKGDANQAPDRWSVHYSASAWKVSAVLPGVGYALAFLQGTGGRVVVGVLIFVIVLALIGPSSARRDDATPAASGVAS